MTVFGNVMKRPPRKRPNVERRGREYLTSSEIERLVDAAAKSGRHGHRDSTLIMLAFRHGLRVGEVVALRWDQVDLASALLHVRRLKNGIPSTHPLHGPELRALRKLRRDNHHGPYVFMSERGSPLSTATVRHIVARAGEVAELELPVHPHMLRHSIGFKLANDGQDTRSIQHYLGHKNIQHTVGYTQLAANRFNDFFDD